MDVNEFIIGNSYNRNLGNYKKSSPHININMSIFLALLEIRFYYGPG